ncbi:MAG: hypothetical protein OXB98_18040 [Bryobacterales bacterium]|nr:hypothetical protein [Bryobacterales bacterium]
MLIAHHSIDGSQASLPASMAGLLEVAVKDARKLDRSIYLPYYNDWHDADSSHNLCLVCLAGSVIAGSLEIAPSDTVSSMTFDRRTEELLDAIDYMRCGLWHKAFELIYHRTPSLQVLDNLQALSEPSFSTFDSWEDFDVHLDSLESMLPQLQSIDRAVARLVKSSLSSSGSPLPASQQ